MSRFLENLVRRGLGETPPGELPLSRPDSAAVEPLSATEAGDSAAEPGDAASEHEQSADAPVRLQQQAAAPGEPTPPLDSVPLPKDAGRPAPRVAAQPPSPPLPSSAMAPPTITPEARQEQASPPDSVPPKRAGRSRRGIVEQEGFVLPPARGELPEPSRPPTPPPPQPSQPLAPLQGHIRARLEAPVETEIHPTPAVRPVAPTLTEVPADDVTAFQPMSPPQPPTSPPPAPRQVESGDTDRTEKPSVERIIERTHERQIIRRTAETASPENAIHPIPEPPRTTVPQRPGPDARPLSPVRPPARSVVVRARLPILKPAPIPEARNAARIPPPVRKAPEAPPHIEVRIGSVEVRAVSQPTPAAARLPEEPTRFEEFDDYRGLRNYFQWFRG